MKVLWKVRIGNADVFVVAAPDSNLDSIEMAARNAYGSDSTTALQRERDGARATFIGMELVRAPVGVVE